MTVKRTPYVKFDGFLRHLVIVAVAVVPLSLCPVAACAQGGVPLWTNVYNAGNHAKAIAVDGSGSVIVTGNAFLSGGPDTGFGTIKYSSTGVPLWTNLYETNSSAAALAVDTNGNVFVTGSSEQSGGGASDYSTIKYSSTGVPLWTNRYNGPGNYQDIPSAVAVDSNGDVFVTGFSDYSNSGPNLEDYATIKYSNVGVPLWTNRYNGPANGSDIARAIVLGANGNVYVTGQSGGVGGRYDYATIAYSSGGVPLWTNRYSGSASNSYGAYAIAKDSGGNVFVMGTAFSTNTVSDYATIKYSSAGMPLWTNGYDGPVNLGDTATAVAVDANGNVFVTGYTTTTNVSPWNYDYATIKYSNAGVPLWTNRYNGPYNDNDYAYAIAVDGSSDVFVTGNSWNGSSYDYTTIAYSSAGMPLWTNRCNGPASLSASAMAVDASGNVFVSGTQPNGYVTVKYSSNIRPFLDIQKINNQVVLSWTNSDFSLQSARAVTGTFTNFVGATSPFTNPTTAPQLFFRLKGN
jgi:hypothetical protein